MPDDQNNQINSMNWGNFGGRARRPLQNQSCPFKRGPPERWPSGLRRTLGKRVCGKPYRGFESHSLRHYTVLLCIRLFELTAKTTSSAITIAASSAMLPLVIAQTVAFDGGFGGRISAMENTWPASSSPSTSNAKLGPANTRRRRPLPHRRGRHVEELELPVLEGRQTALAWPRLAHGRCALMPIVGSMIAQGRAPDYAKTTAGRAGGRLRRVGFRIDEKPRRWSTTPTTP